MPSYHDYVIFPQAIGPVHATKPWLLTRHQIAAVLRIHRNISRDANKAASSQNVPISSSLLLSPRDTEEDQFLRFLVYNRPAP